MGQLLPKMKSSFVEDMITSIAANGAHYYIFAANPIETFGLGGQETKDDASAYHENNNTLLFGKKLKTTDIAPIINNVTWTTNTVYARYDNTKDLSNSSFYVITPPTEVGGYRHVFKCLDNANGAPSTEKPNQVQVSSFTKSDGYMWRYIYSISYTDYEKFATDEYVPISPNTTIVAQAYTYTGVEVVPIVNAGAGYNAYHDGIVQSVANTTVIQIENRASAISNFYQNNAIYLTNNNSPTAQLFTISSSVSNASGNWVVLTSNADTSIIVPGITNYKISPRVVFDTDGEEPPLAYTVISNTVNSIANVVIVDTGYGVTRATASIVTSSVAPVAVQANVYCIVPPPGGHGYRPDVELYTKGMSISMEFSGTESDTIPTNVSYNKIGIMKNPYTLTGNNTKGLIYTSNTFSSLFKAIITGGHSYNVGETVIGQSSKAKGTVAFANATQIHLIGDKDFLDDEVISNEDGDNATIVSIFTLGDIYTKDLVPMYYRNIVDVSRSNTQVESFKLLIEV